MMATAEGSYRGVPAMIEAESVEAGIRVVVGVHGPHVPVFMGVVFPHGYKHDAMAEVLVMLNLCKHASEPASQALRRGETAWAEQNRYEKEQRSIAAGKRKAGER